MIIDRLGPAASDNSDVETAKYEINPGKDFRHRTLEKRLADYGNEISVADFDWGELLGKEML